MSLRGGKLLGSSNKEGNSLSKFEIFGSKVSLLGDSKGSFLTIKAKIDCSLEDKRSLPDDRRNNCFSRGRYLVCGRLLTKREENYFLTHPVEFICVISPVMESFIVVCPWVA